MSLKAKSTHESERTIRRSLIETALLTNIEAESGFAFTAPTNRPELSSHERPSPAQVTEDGKPLRGPGNAEHDDIRKVGNGRYSFWHDSVYFSSSDNSDPRTNGRLYEISYPAADRQKRGGIQQLLLAGIDMAEELLREDAAHLDLHEETNEKVHALQEQVETTSVKLRDEYTGLAEAIRNELNVHVSSLRDEIEKFVGMLQQETQNAAEQFRREIRDEMSMLREDYSGLAETIRTDLNSLRNEQENIVAVVRQEAANTATQLRQDDLTYSDRLRHQIDDMILMIREEMTNLTNNASSHLLLDVEAQIARTAFDLLVSIMKTRELGSKIQVEEPSRLSSMHTRPHVRTEPFGEYLEKFKQLHPHLFDVWESVNFGINIEEFRDRPEASCAVATRTTARLFGGFIAPYLHGRVLDVGCGPYATPCYLAGYPPELISGVDPIEPFEPHPFEFVRGFAEFLPWDDGVFDVVIAATTLDHLIDLELGLSELQRVLKPRGTFLVWDWFGEDSAPYNPATQAPQLVDRYHLFNFDERWFEELMKKYFTIVERIKLYGEWKHDHYYCLRNERF